MIEHGPLIERLLAGDFICQTTDEHYFAKLQDEGVRQAIDDYLKPLNRRIASDEDANVYFLSYVHIDEAARKQVQQNFTHTIQALLPMLEFMQLVQETMGRDGTLSEGEVIKLQEFSLKIEDNQALKQGLNQLARSSLFKSTSEAVDQQLKLVFKRVKELGYVYQPHSERQVYIVTGKIEHLIELVRFIKQQENIEFEELVPPQGDLF